MTVYAFPGTEGAKVEFKSRYEHFIGGEWTPPVKGQYFENVTPVTGKVFCEVARGTAEDIDVALDAAWKAAPAWGATSAAERALVLHRIADRMEENLEMLAVAETWDNGKAVRETLNADLPLAIDHFRYFAGAIRAQEGGLSQVDEDTVAYHFHEPLGVVGQIIPWNFPLLMGVWKLAPALAAGNAVVIKPAEQTPASIMVFIELIADLLPAGVVNVVNGFGLEAGKPLAQSPRIRKIAFTGETTTGRLIMQYASENIIPVTLELGGKSPNVFFEDVMAADDAYWDKAQEGFTLFALNQGEVCTCPSRALVQESIAEKFLDAVVERTSRIVTGNPLDTDMMMGAQASNDQLEKITSYLDIGRQEGAEVLIGGARAEMEGELAGGYYVQPTIFRGDNSMRIFQEEIFGPVVSTTTFTDFDDAMRIANDTLYGLGAGVWSRNGNTAYRAGRAIQAGRVWVNNYHAYPAHAAFGGYKSSGIGRENHLMMLDHYQQTKNLLVSYSEDKLGFF
ncbi:aldehyde dehydrogenase family protein [Micrococcus luteus]|uniref:acetaldehyde dehydrogenase ExaC n=1 Tax=Micrococcus TaxID=1269 RepID=UPI0007653EB3|nr:MULTISPECIES: aldehyde dehydrogenase family protein [Micrococcus]CVN83037.1 Non-phosphorylating glyceraldehyde-3-phosphate dehydrogenase (NADP) [Streptococcus pneumoniae]MCV7471246.1 aldehyde dehydrogenase family protein [Micrococcus luteus]MCV7486068.1 aldehyde dehydrogenase family protein [Micrococcus luteus]MCV7598453.1 aldehyde dehydrogenase family protein [Micrococcus luteus]MCV7686144.1 aldehyde dehydrogenase family protein [Micrococcus luteus]